jgi:hypothetical protein
MVLDADSGGTISPTIAYAAVPIERLAETLQVPVHLMATGVRPPLQLYVIRLSLKERPPEGPSFAVGSATLVCDIPRL